MAGSKVTAAIRAGRSGRDGDSIRAERKAAIINRPSAYGAGRPAGDGDHERPPGRPARARPPGRAQQAGSARAARE
jgi:hypothetical protein